MANIKISGITFSALSDALKDIDDAEGFKGNVTSAAKRLNMVNRGNNDGSISEEEVGVASIDDYDNSRVSLLRDYEPGRKEQTGAKTLIEIMKETPIVEPALPAVTGEITIPARPRSITVDDVIRDYGDQSRSYNGLAGVTFDPFTRAMASATNGVQASVQYKDIAKRVAETVKANRDNNSNDLTPDLLKAFAFTGDFYPNDGKYDELATWTTPQERTMLAELYDRYFNPKPVLPPELTRTVSALGDMNGFSINIDVKQRTDFFDNISMRKGPVTTLTPTEYVLKGVPGTVVMYASMSSAKPMLDKTIVIGANGEARIPFGNVSRGLVGVVMRDDDGVGPLTAKILGHFAISNPATRRIYGPDAHQLNGKDWESVDQNGTKV